MSVAFNKQDQWGNSTGRCGRNHHLCFGKQASTSWLQRKMKPLLWKLQILAVNYCRRLFARTFILVRYSWFFFTVKLYEGVGKKGNFIPFAGSKSILLVVVACLRSSWSKALHHWHNRWPEAATKPVKKLNQERKIQRFRGRTKTKNEWRKPERKKERKKARIY